MRYLDLAIAWSLDRLAQLADRGWCLDTLDQLAQLAEHYADWRGYDIRHS